VSLMPLVRNSHVVRLPLPACHFPFASVIFSYGTVSGDFIPDQITIIIIPHTSLRS